MLNFGNKEFRNLQEQVLKNAQDIEILKGREDLQIVIVNELPEVGNPNYIYLVAKDDGESPDVYEEYIWLEDEERYEKIGGVSIDLTNYVTLDTTQTITGLKTINEKIMFTSEGTVHYGFLETANQFHFLSYNGSVVPLRITGYHVIISYDLLCQSDNTTTIGSSTKRIKDLYLAGQINLGTNMYIKNHDDTNGYIDLMQDNTRRFTVGANIYSYVNILPGAANLNLGSSSMEWKNLYLTGNISDGLNTVTVANIASKTTSTYASGTFDSNGESTIDISGGTPEGLFIFTYGNCQCFIRLTAAMISSADVTPIRVSCPLIYNNATKLGWLEITKSSNTLTITIINGDYEHVDSGYAWTLVKTNLI